MLTTKFGFAAEDIRLLIDEDDPDNISYAKPNWVNIKASLNWLCTNRSVSDVIYFHFSGHGTQLLDTSGGVDDCEPDLLDEAIQSADWCSLTDDDIKQYFRKLPLGTKATVTMDCCHSGTLLDSQNVIIGPRDLATASTVETTRNISGHEVKEESANRSVSIEQISTVLQDLHPSTDVVSATVEGVSKAMAEIHGATACKLTFEHCIKKLDETGNNTDGVLSKFVTHALASIDEHSPDQSEQQEEASRLLKGEQAEVLKSAVAKQVKGDDAAFQELAQSGSTQNTDIVRNAVGNIISEIGLEGQQHGRSVPTYFSVPYSPAAASGTLETTVVLLPGCQPSETCADVQKTDKSKCHGAFSKAFVDIVTEHMENAEQNSRLSYIELITQVRNRLGEDGFPQNPGLETSKGSVDDPFIV